jgi:hypothetical protein
LTIKARGNTLAFATESLLENVEVAGDEALVCHWSLMENFGKHSGRCSTGCQLRLDILEAQNNYNM